MTKQVIVREDDPDLAQLVDALLTDVGYAVTAVVEIEDLLTEAARLSPCVALVDSTGGSAFDLWWVGPKLRDLGVPALAFTAHASAREEFAADPRGYVGVVSKPFDAEEFIESINQICWEEHQAAAS